MHGKGDDKLEPKKIPKISGYSGREEELVAPKDFRNNEIAGGRKDKEGNRGKDHAVSGVSDFHSEIFQIFVEDKTNDQQRKDEE